MAAGFYLGVIATSVGGLIPAGLAASIVAFTNSASLILSFAAMGLIAPSVILGWYGAKVDQTTWVEFFVASVVYAASLGGVAFYWHLATDTSGGFAFFGLIVPIALVQPLLVGIGYAFFHTWQRRAKCPCYRAIS